MYSPSGSGEVHVDKVISGKKGGSRVPYEIRMNNGRHCVYKKGTDKNLGCHDTHDGAQQQLAALYASEGMKGMDEGHYSYLVSLDSINLEEVNGVSSCWVHALPIGKYNHPVLGVLDITAQRAAKFAESVNNKVRGIEPSINYNHNNKDEAAGWTKKAEARSDGLWLFVEWVDDAAEKIKKKKYKYFSAEIMDKWVDAAGKEFSDVLFGGGLSNRPFMKNLVPINLSESTIENAFELVSTITGTSVDNLKGDGMQLSEEDLKKITDSVIAGLKGTKPAEPEPTKLEDIAELKALAEDNPTVKALLHHFETQGSNLHETTKVLRETQVQAKLAEFDNSKLTLTPSAKELLREIMTHEKLPTELSEKLWGLMEQVRTSQSFLVELGERSGAGVRYGYGMVEKSATQEFSERVNKLMAEEKASFLDAADKVARDDPELFNAYRAGDGAKK
jgi:hypothetical protein